MGKKALTALQKKAKRDRKAANRMARQQQEQAARTAAASDSLSPPPPVVSMIDSIPANAATNTSTPTVVSTSLASSTSTSPSVLSSTTTTMSSDSLASHISSSIGTSASTLTTTISSTSPVTSRTRAIPELPSTTPTTTATAANSTTTTSDAAALALPSTTTANTTTTATTTSSTSDAAAPVQPAPTVDPLFQPISEANRLIAKLWGQTFATADVATLNKLIPLRQALAHMHFYLCSGLRTQNSLTPQQPTPNQQPLAYLQELKRTLEETRTALLNAMTIANQDRLRLQAGLDLLNMHDQILGLEVHCGIDQSITSLSTPQLPTATPPAPQPVPADAERERQEAECVAQAERERAAAQAEQDRLAQAERERTERERVAREAASTNVHWKETLVAAGETVGGTAVIHFGRNILLRTVIGLGLASSTPVAGLILASGTIGLGLTLGCLSGKCSKNTNSSTSLDSSMASAVTSVSMLLFAPLSAVIIGGGAVCAYHMSKYKVEDRAAQRTP